MDLECWGTWQLGILGISEGKAWIPLLARDTVPHKLVCGEIPTSHQAQGQVPKEGH